jgi:N6-adenosine-specific RNA methylase IME4
VADLHNLIQLGHRFGAIYADPPWQYTNQVARGAAGKHYDLMTVDEITTLPVHELAADNAHLHLWTTNAFLREALDVLAAWGFRYTGNLVWAKHDQGKLQMGTGNFWRNCHELLLLGVRGDCRFLDHAQHSLILAPRGQHSAKPAVIREMIEKVSPGPWLDLFGRSPARGWAVWGNEVGRDALDAAVKELATQAELEPARPDQGEPRLFGTTSGAAPG